MNTVCDECGISAPDKAAVIVEGQEWGFCGLACMVLFVRQTWPNWALASSLSDRRSAADGRGRDDGGAREPVASGKSSVAPGPPASIGAA